MTNGTKGFKSKRRPRQRIRTGSGGDKFCETLGEVEHTVSGERESKKHIIR